MIDIQAVLVHFCFVCTIHKLKSWQKYTIMNFAEWLISSLIYVNENVHIKGCAQNARVYFAFSLKLLADKFFIPILHKNNEGDKIKNYEPSVIFSIFGIFFRCHTLNYRCELTDFCIQQYPMPQI
jgi:hypothetical protein